MVQYKKYKPLLLENSENPGVAVDSNDQWDILVKSCPFQLLPEQKTLAVNDWDDENGEEVFFPAHPVYKAYDLEVVFLCVTDEGTANEKIRDFWKFLQHAPLKMYDEYTRIGRQQIYYKSYTPNSLYRREGNKDVVEFSLTFRVCDPITDITLSKA